MCVCVCVDQWTDWSNKRVRDFVFYSPVTWIRLSFTLVKLLYTPTKIHTQRDTHTHSWRVSEQPSFSFRSEKIFFCLPGGEREDQSELLCFYRWRLSVVNLQQYHCYFKLRVKKSLHERNSVCSVVWSSHGWCHHSSHCTHTLSLQLSITLHVCHVSKTIHLRFNRRLASFRFICFCGAIDTRHQHRVCVSECVFRLFVLSIYCYITLTAPAFSQSTKQQ